MHKASFGTGELTGNLIAGLIFAGLIFWLLISAISRR